MLQLILVAVIVCVLVSLWVYGRWNFGTLEKMGIPVVDHHPLLGSVKAIYKEAGALKDIEWMNKHGPVFGVYEGRLPQVFICDAELIRKICVKDAEHFNSKRLDFDFGDPLMNEMPDFLPLEKWRAVRAMTTPAFSSAKIKLMSIPMREATMDYVKNLKEQIKNGEGVYENVAVDESIHTMLTDLISRCVFSINISDPTDTNNHFARLVQQMLCPPHSRNSTELVMWSHTYPFLQKFMGGTMLDPKPAHEFIEIFKNILAERRKSGEKKNDVVDLCLEWYDKLDTPEFKAAQITELTLMCQVLVYFFAGQDQISTVLTTMLYHIAKDPEIEAKVYEEIDAAFERHNGKIEHEHLNELVYLNACLSESLRLYPFFYRTERTCTKDWDSNDKFNLHIKKGTFILIPIWAINRNPEYVENPEKYDPSRWLPENKDKLNIYSTTAFGHGPRSCTGKRFATEANPMVAAYLLKELKFIARKDSKLNFIPGGSFFAAHDKIHLDIVERNKVAAAS